MSRFRRSQQCPICGASHSQDVRWCRMCGAALPGVPTPDEAMPPVSGAEAGNAPPYDPANGDDDLYAGDLSGRLWRFTMGAGLIVVLLVGIGIGIMVGRFGGGDSEPGNDGEVRIENMTTLPPTVPPTATLRESVGSPTVTPTLRATMALVTVTPAPPTPTITPTPGPCFQTAQSGDTVYGMAVRCGHVDLAVVDLILEINDMESPNELQVDQVLEIPWPTPTPGSESAAPPADVSLVALENATAGVTEGTPEVLLNEFGTPDVLATYQYAEPTLRPGQAWHTVQVGETIIGIAVLYDTNVETLSQINPEVPFLQCDYSFDSGGPNCSVMLYDGQRLRVPVPLPTTTPTPSPEGTLTPTPSITPTFNAPFPNNPENGAHFNADEMVTVRWGGTGTLAENERYLIRVHDLDTDKEYTALVTELSVILPADWQPDDGSTHTVEWAVSVVAVDAQNNLVSEGHATESRQFTWDSR
ncbi:MAG: LysM peptidoglycan-binding domain-containing protein [Anaerolineae bacterium]|nr:LysM peptidoglycan-binding domain-containing protein [Anaerolineae bacterium]